MVDYEQSLGIDYISVGFDVDARVVVESLALTRVESERFATAIGQIYVIPVTVNFVVNQSLPHLYMFIILILILLLSQSTGGVGVIVFHVIGSVVDRSGH